MKFLPDADPMTPGLIVDCRNIIPTKKGYRSAYTGVSAGYPAIATAVQSFAAIRKVDDTVRLLAGTLTKLYEVSGTTWVDRTRASGGNYASTARWCFAQVGNLTLAVNLFDVPQQSLTGAFSNLATMPRSALIVTSGDFVLAANVDLGGGAGIEGDRWISSAIGNYADWAPDTATQCVTNRETETPGPFTAMKALGNSVVLYKRRSLFLLDYQGPPVAWSSRLVSADVGAVGNGAVVTLPSAHLFIGVSDIFSFDGTAPMPIGDGIREWFFNRLDKVNQGAIQSAYDRARELVYWFYPVAGGTGALTEWIAFNTATKQWGAGTLNVEAAAEFLTASQTWDSWGLGLTWDTLPQVHYDSPYWGSSTPYPAFFDSAHTLKLLAGLSANADYTTGFVGANEGVSLVSRVTPKYIIAPTSGTLTPYSKMESGIAVTTGTPVTMSRGRFDFLLAAKWHQFKIDTVGDFEFSSLYVAAKPLGAE